MPKVWLITGASRGLGKSLVEYALAQGDSVIATARSASALSYTDKYGDKVLAYTLDVTDYDTAAAAVLAGHAKFGRIDILVNNAGYAKTAAFEDMAIEDFRGQIETNLFGVVNVSKAVIPIMRQQGSGFIVHISSIGARLGSPGLSAYQSAKWAVSGLAHCLAVELAAFGVKVTSLESGGIRTDWAGSSMEIPTISEPYQQSVGAFANFLRDNTGKEPSLPEKFGPIIDKLYAAPDPPVRMLVGPEAVAYGAQLAEGLKQADEKWADLAKSSVE